MKINKFTKLLGIAGIITSLSIINPAPAYSATDGTLGFTSTATKLIRLILARLVKITNVDDVLIDGFDPETPTDQIDLDTVCIFANNNSGGYTVTMSAIAGDGSTGFSASDPTGLNKVPYEIEWTDSAVTSYGNGEIFSDGDTKQFAGASTSPNCGGSDNATIGVKFTATDLSAADATNTGVADDLSTALTSTVTIVIGGI